MKQILLAVGLFFGIKGISQTVNDQVSLSVGNVNQSYYSLENGEISNVSNTDWDIAFDVSPFGSAIRVNHQAGAELYLASTDTSNWSTIDTVNLGSWPVLHNSDQSWSEGAFNADHDEANPVDLGWGLYNTITHFITGNKIFVMKWMDGSVKKVWIKVLASGTYTFLVADIDNTNMVTQTITKSDYSTKNFIYYSVSNQMTIDREPATTDWDIVFTKYVGELAPNVYYGVTGTLANIGVNVHENRSALSDDIDFNYTYAYGTEINIVGYDWKSFDFQSGTYIMEDSLAYFIEDQVGDVWKMVFTSFGGSATGDIEFTKSKVGFASVEEALGQVQVNAYPNPAQGLVLVQSSTPMQAYTLVGMNGQVVLSANLDQQTQATLSLDQLSNGIYFLNINTTSGLAITKKIIKQ